MLRTLRERSAALAPVEPRFHPDLAPLLARVVDRVANHERQRRIAEFNVWHPPEPEEWRTADSALPSDVDNPQRAREHYSTLSEHLVALLHTQVPSVFEATPESLSDADLLPHPALPRRRAAPGLKRTGASTRAARPSP